MPTSAQLRHTCLHDAPISLCPKFPNVLVSRLWLICGECNLRGFYDIPKALFKYSLYQS